MDTAPLSITRCPVFLHPAAASNPETIRTVQRATGQVVMLAAGRPQLKLRPSFDGFGPFGGDAA